MYTIGQFSKIVRISAKTLRYYDEINLLNPAYVDHDTQYRYYCDGQVQPLLFICELKEYGLKLEQIKAVIDSKDAELLKIFLQNKICEIDNEMQQNLKLKRSINLKLSKIKSGGNMMETNNNLIVELKNREPLVVAARKATISMNNIGSVIGKVFEDIYHANLQPSGPIMTVYYNSSEKEFDEENANIEVCIPINKNTITEKSDNIRNFSGGLHACTTFIGPYSRLGEAYSKVIKWINDNGFKCTEAPFDIYLEGAKNGKGQDQFVTEVCFPVSKITNII